MLRDELSNYLAIMARTAGATAGRIDDQGYLLTCIEDLCRSESKIQLLLNPKEDDHVKLIGLLKKASSSLWYLNYNKKDSFPEDMNKLREDIIDISQPILKREWNRVKKLK